MSDAGEHSSLPPDFGRMPDEHVPPAAGSRLPPPLPVSGIDAGAESHPDVPVPSSGRSPPTSPPAVSKCSSCGSPYVAMGSESICPACRRVLGGLSSATPARAPFEVNGLVCTNCGFDLTGLRSDGGCPECGTPVARSIPPWSALDGEPFLVRGHPCLNCGYDLTGLRSDGACPECGTPVERSLKGNLLRFAAPGYVRGLAIGILITEVASVGALVNMFLPIGATVAARGAGMSGAGVALATSSASIVLSGASFVGWWLFSAPEPARLGRDEAMGARKLLRASVIVEFVISFVRFATTLLPIGATRAVMGPAVGPGAGAPLWMGLAVAGVALLGIGAYLFRFFSSMAYLRSVARRFPDANLYASATRFMWLGPVLAISSIVTCFLSLAVAFVFYLIILDRTRRLLRSTLAGMSSAQGT